jgi:hypothetical protein
MSCTSKPAGATRTVGSTHRKIYGHQLAVVTSFDGGKPDFLSLGTPCQAGFRFPFGGECSHLPRSVHYSNIAAVVPKRGMVHERNLIASGRESDVTDPAVTLIKNRTEGKLQTAAAIDVMNNCQFPFRIPIGPAHVFQQFAWRATRQRGPRQSSPRKVQE